MTISSGLNLGVSSTANTADTLVSRNGSGETAVSALSFDSGSTFLDTASQCAEYQVVLGTGNSALTEVSGVGSSGQLLTSNGSGSAPSWQNSTADAFNIVNVTNSDNPYLVDFTHNYIACRTSTGPITLILPNEVSFSGLVYIKDSDGQSETNNITITTISGLVYIDNYETITINEEYNSVNIAWNTDHYEVF